MKKWALFQRCSKPAPARKIGAGADGPRAKRSIVPAQVGNTLRSAVGVAAFGNFAAPLAICLVLYYSATLAFTLRPSIAPVEALGLRLSYKILSLSLIAASAGTIVILALARTPPALGALLGVAAALWAYECSEQLDRQHAKKHKDD